MTRPNRACRHGRLRTFTFGPSVPSWPCPAPPAPPAPAPPAPDRQRKAPPPATWARSRRRALSSAKAESLETQHGNIYCLRFALAGRCERETASKQRSCTRIDTMNTASSGPSWGRWLVCLLLVAACLVIAPAAGAASHDEPVVLATSSPSPL